MSPPSPFGRPTHFSRLRFGFLAGCFLWFLAFARAEELPTTGTGADSDLLPALQLEPFVVNGDALAVTIHARNKRDRRYAEGFADEVVRVAHDTLDGSTGRGLIIVGDDGEPHPLWVFRKFLAMADAGQLDAAVAARADELRASLAEWEEAVDLDEDDNEMGLSFDLVVPALPLPLKGLGSRLYQVAWIERFEVEKVELAFHHLRAGDLDDDRLARFHWVYFLPPKNAFDRVLKIVVPIIMEQEEMGFFARATVRSALVVFKPAINRAIEGIRKGLLFRSILQERTEWSADDIDALTEAYVRVLMPDFKFNDGRNATHDRAMEAIAAQKQANLDYAKDPFVAPTRLTTFDAADYAGFVGDYRDVGAKEVTHRFRIVDDGAFHWTYREQDPMVFYPAGPRLMVIEDGSMTIEFQIDDTGAVTGVEERWKRKRKTVPRD